ncbi:lipoprotein N-acyltransferase Lnb domain-containing protein [Fibrella aquatica]|uniref:lipoprotein N-acyltransferase Lnb domain-containing protein n=1 Tax=Fibrella aquatica TaxID=3242487 RepID=UPI0035223C29
MSLITYGPGNDDISSVFGHTEIRITDPATGIDVNYSYGGFDYRADYFELKFLRGTLPYHISSHNLFQVAYYYQQNNRSIREQVLNMSAPQRQRLYTALETNLLPQNREYSYKFYYDNCSTRPRDMITAAMGDSLLWSPQVKQPTKSYRGWMNDYLGAKPWERLGMNLAIGRPADKVTSGWEAMYLPNNVFDQLTKAQVRLPNGQLVPLVAQTQTIFEGQPFFKNTLPIVAYPDFVFLVLLIIVALLTWIHWNRGERAGFWLDRVLFGFAGAWGWFLFLLWFATDHGVTTWNPTLLWLMPLHLPGVFWATSPKRHPFERGTYFRITALLLIVSLFILNAPGFADTLFVGTLLVRALFRSWVKTERPVTELVRG